MSVYQLLMFLFFLLGFFVDLNLFKVNKEKAAELAKNNDSVANNVNGSSGTSGQEGLADEDANLMIKLKFLTYKVHMLVQNRNQICAEGA